jgi:hypothetical protein
MNQPIRQSIFTSIGVVAVSLVAIFGSDPAVAQEETVLERLQRIEDKEAIRTLLERFFEYQETGNREAYGDLFAENGEMLLRRGHLTGGPEGIRGPARPNRTEANADAETEPTRHILSNIYIEVDGDTATAQSRWTMLVPLEEPNRFRLGGSGRYCDKLVRENGEWKILQRIIYCQVPEGMEPVN